SASCFRSSGALPVMSTWLRVTCWVGRYPSRVALWYEQGHIVFVTFVTHRPRPNSGITPRITPFLVRHVCKVADAMIEAQPTATERASRPLRRVWREALWLLHTGRQSHAAQPLSGLGQIAIQLANEPIYSFRPEDLRLWEDITGQGHRTRFPVPSVSISMPL